MQQALADFHQGERLLRLLRVQPVNHCFRPGLCAFEDFQVPDPVTLGPSSDRFVLARVGIW